MVSNLFSGSNSRWACQSHHVSRLANSVTPIANSVKSSRHRLLLACLSQIHFRDNDALDIKFVWHSRFILFCLVSSDLRRKKKPLIRTALYTCTYIHIYDLMYIICICVWTWVQTGWALPCERACREAQGSASNIFLYHCPLDFLRNGFSLTWKRRVSASLAGQQAPWINTGLLHQYTNIQATERSRHSSLAHRC